MSMLTNRPSPKCSVKEHNGSGRPCRGPLHQFDVQMFAKLDGTPVTDAPVEKTYICVGHAPPDRDDPNYLLCDCALCKERRNRQQRADR